MHRAEGPSEATASSSRKAELQKKNLDFIVLNSLNDAGAGFAGDTNKITIIDRELKKTTFDLKSKEAVARDICNRVAQLING